MRAIGRMEYRVMFTQSALVSKQHDGANHAVVPLTNASKQLRINTIRDRQI